jgi:hypothetical protein
MKTAAYVSALMLVVVGALPRQARAADRITPPSVPAAIAVADAYTPFLMGHAVGTQNYICVSSGGVLKWLFIGPQATVFDGDGEQILTHFLSTNPFQDVIHATWQHSRDTSAVWAKKLSGSLDPAYVEPGAIEWLLLGSTGTAEGPTAGDKLARTVYIQRVHTKGGVEPPAGSCTDSTLNNRALVRYEADYVFFR